VLFCVCDESVVDPDRCRTDPAVRERLVSRALERLPDLARTGVSSFWAGMRTFARDQRFAIGPDPDLPGLHWVAGLGGHGMVCAAPAGELAADGLLGGTGDDDLRSAFDPSRLVPGKDFSPPVPRRGPDRGFPLQGTPLGSRSLPFEAP
jgi:D-arginine dehydrogenase